MRRATKLTQPQVAPNNDDKRRKRRWTWRILSIVLSPLVLLAAVELFLWAAGYGRPTEFFLRRNFGGREVYVENQDFGYRFFPPAMVRRPQPCVMDANKAPGVKRIFVFGESAAMGDPIPAFGLSRVMEALLRNRFPETKFEIINVSMTAINSHVLLSIARDCVQREGDVWVFYMGNNEVVGPFGRGTVFSQQAPPMDVVRANLAFKTTRLGQLLSNLSYRMQAKSGQPNEWGGMEMFLKQQVRSDDLGMSRVYAHFEENLTDMLQLAKRSGAKVVISTLAANLKDCAPFASLHRPDMAAADLDAWMQEFGRGVSLQDSGDYTGALECYQRACKVDGGFADLFYREGQCSLALDRVADARVAFERALELDTLRFRSDKRINDILRKVSAKGSDVFLADAAMAVAEHSPRGLPGDELLYEHVHPTFEGNYWIGLSLAERVATAIPDLKPSGEWLSLDACARKLALTPWDQYRAADLMFQRMQNPPFSNQSDARERQSRWHQRAEGYKAQSSPDALAGFAKSIAEALQHSPGDWCLHVNRAQLLQTIGNDTEAIAEWNRVTEILPHDPEAACSLGNALEKNGKIAEARACFQKAIVLRPECVEAYNGLGLCLADEGNQRDAAESYRHALAVRPNYIEGHVNLGVALAKLGQVNEAMGEYQLALQQSTNNASAHGNLGKLLAQQGRVPEAIEHYQKAVAAASENPTYHFNLGNALDAVGKPGEAIAQYAKAVELQSDFVEARLNWGLVLAKQGKKEQALQQFEQTVQRFPNHADAQFNLAVAYAQLRRWNEAVTHFTEVLRLDPNNVEARKNLESAKALAGKSTRR